MESLEKIIKIKKKELEDQRTRIFDLEKLLTDLKEQFHQVESLILREEEFVSKNPDYMHLFPAFNEKSSYNLSRIKDQITAVSSAISAERDYLIELFSEIKKYEIALSKRIQERDYLQKKQENANLDDVSIMNWNKNNLTKTEMD